MQDTLENKIDQLLNAGWTQNYVGLWSPPNCMQTVPFEKAWQMFLINYRCEEPLV